MRVKVWSLIGKTSVVASGLTVLTAVTLLSLAAEYTSLGDRLSHFTFYWALLALSLVVLASLGKRWILCAVGGLLFAVHAVPVLRLWLPDSDVPSPSVNAVEITVVSANLYVNNARQPEAVAKLMELSPDLLVLMEVGDRWQPALRPILARFAYTVGTDGDFWLLSRYPLRLAARTEIGGGGLSPLLEATLVAGDSAIRVVAIHAPTPRGAARLAQQRRQATDYARALNRDGAARCRMLIGDFNTTPFSKEFRHILKTTGLRDSSRGCGYHPTWGPRLPKEPLLPWLGVPIDHALVSDQVLVKERRVGTMPGSDHRYQETRLRF